MHRSIVLALGLLVPLAASAVPTVAVQQGRLLDSTSTPLDGAHDITVALYADETSTTNLWSESHTGIDFDNGYYTLRLGDVTALDSTVLDGSELYLGITVDGGTELPDRLAIVSVPYAVRANDATNVNGGGIVDASEIRIDGTTVIDSSGTISGSVDWSDVTGKPFGFDDDDDSDTLLALTCNSGELAMFDGLDWQCAALSAGTIDAGDVVSGTLDYARLPIGTGSDQVAVGDHSHAAADADTLDGRDSVDFADATHSHPAGDADTLDGQDSADFATSGHTHAAGDADTLDGQDSADFATSGHAHAAGDADTLDGLDSNDFAGAGHGHSVDFTDLTGAAVVGQLPVGSTASHVAAGNHSHPATGLDALSCADGEIARRSSGSWACAPDPTAKLLDTVSVGTCVSTKGQADGWYSAGRTITFDKVSDDTLVRLDYSDWVICDDDDGGGDWCAVTGRLLVDGTPDRDIFYQYAERHDFGNCTLWTAYPWNVEKSLHIDGLPAGTHTLTIEYNDYQGQDDIMIGRDGLEATLTVTEL